MGTLISSCLTITPVLFILLYNDKPRPNNDPVIAPIQGMNRYKSPIMLCG
ncbi:hypothetical protein [Aquimarina addita]